MASPTQPDDDEHVLRAALALDDVDEITQHGALLERAEAVARQGHGDPIVGRIQLQRARLFAQLGDHERGYECGLQASRVLERCGDAVRAIRALGVCTTICIEIGDTERALEHSRLALAKARAVGDVEMQMGLLNNQALSLCGVEEYEAALGCSEEAARIGRGKAKVSVERTRSVRAVVRMRQADALERQGRTDDARAGRRRAVAGLPEFTESSPLALVHDILDVRTRLGSLAQARAAAVQLVRCIRRESLSQRRLSQAWLTLGLFHSRAGRPDKGAHRMERAIRKMREIGCINELVSAERQLAATHAATGRFDKALHWVRQAHADDVRLQSEQSRIRSRIAALERDAEEHVFESQTTLLHAQRLAVVGRLMAQIYHALERPIAEARLTIERCLDGAAAASPQGLSEALTSVVARIDEASTLARQLKMFSYRATPQAIEVDLPTALQEAWRSVAIGHVGPVAPLALQGERPPPVRVDAQRLAVLLLILLIEAERMGDHQAPAVRFEMQGAFVRVDFVCSTPAGDAPGVGVTLCEEIAREMAGSLTCRIPGPGHAMRFSLELPAEA